MVAALVLDASPALILVVEQYGEQIGPAFRCGKAARAALLLLNR
jgi:hypothetical protein